MDNEDVASESLGSRTERAIDARYEEEFTNEETREIFDIRSVDPQSLAANQPTETED